MCECIVIVLSLLSCLTVVLCGTPVVTIKSKEECTTYVLVHNVLDIEWFANTLLNCTVHVETIKRLAEYEYLCITPKQLYFPSCIAMVTVYEGSITNPVMTRNCFNNLDPTICSNRSQPFIIKFTAGEKSAAHVIIRVEGRNGPYAPAYEEYKVNYGLTTQIVVGVGSVTTFLGIVVCVVLSCRHSRYRSCDNMSERSSPRTIQTENGEGEATERTSVPERDLLLHNSNRQSATVHSHQEQRNTPPPSYWDVVEPADSVVK